MEGLLGGAAAVEDLRPSSLEEVALHRVHLLTQVCAGQVHIVLLGVAMHRLQVKGLNRIRYERNQSKRICINTCMNCMYICIVCMHV